MALTPLDPGGDWPQPGKKWLGLPGHVVSACLERPVMAGGWFSTRIGAEFGPQGNRPLMRPGSVVFLEGASASDIAAKRAEGRLKIGCAESLPWGYGRIALGRY